VFLFLVKECLLDTRNRSCDALVLDVTSYIHMYIYIRPSLLRMYIHAGCAGCPAYPYADLSTGLRSSESPTDRTDRLVLTMQEQHLMISRVSEQLLSPFSPSLPLSFFLSFFRESAPNRSRVRKCGIGERPYTHPAYTCIYMRTCIWILLRGVDCSVILLASIPPWYDARDHRAVVSVVAGRCV